MGCVTCGIINQELSRTVPFEVGHTAGLKLNIVHPCIVFLVPTKSTQRETVLLDKDHFLLVESV